MAHAIGTADAFQVIGFNKDGSQFKLCGAHSLAALLGEYAKKAARFEATNTANDILGSFLKITVWNVTDGFTGFDLPYIETV